MESFPPVLPGTTEFAVVTTVTVTGTGVFPRSVTEGASAQAVLAGAPEQVNPTVPLNPPVEARDRL